MAAGKRQQFKAPSLVLSAQMIWAKKLFCMFQWVRIYKYQADNKKKLKGEGALGGSVLVCGGGGVLSIVR